MVLEIPESLSSESVARLVIQIIGLKEKYSKNEKSKKILRDATKILLSQDDGSEFLNGDFSDKLTQTDQPEQQTKKKKKKKRETKSVHLKRNKKGKKVQLKKKKKPKKRNAKRLNSPKASSLGMSHIQCKLQFTESNVQNVSKTEFGDCLEDTQDIYLEHNQELRSESQISELENIQKSDFENNQKLHLEHNQISDFENNQKSVLEDKEKRDLGDNQKSDLGGHQKSDFGDNQKSDLKDNRKSDLEDIQKSGLEDKQKLHLRDNQKSALEDKQKRDLGDNRKSDLEDNQKFENDAKCGESVVTKDAKATSIFQQKLRENFHSKINKEDRLITGSNPSKEIRIQTKKKIIWKNETFKKRLTKAAKRGNTRMNTGYMDASAEIKNHRNGFRCKNYGTKRFKIIEIYPKHKMQPVRDFNEIDTKCYRSKRNSLDQSKMHCYTSNEEKTLVANFIQMETSVNTDTSATFAKRSSLQTAANIRRRTMQFISKKYKFLKKRYQDCDVNEEKHTIQSVTSQHKPFKHSHQDCDVREEKPAVQSARPSEHIFLTHQYQDCDVNKEKHTIQSARPSEHMSPIHRYQDSDAKVGKEPSTTLQLSQNSLEKPSLQLSKKCFVLNTQSEQCFASNHSPQKCFTLIPSTQFSQNTSLEFSNNCLLVKVPSQLPYLCSSPNAFPQLSQKLSLDNPSPELLEKRFIPRIQTQLSEKDIISSTQLSEKGFIPSTQISEKDFIPSLQLSGKEFIRSPHLSEKGFIPITPPQLSQKYSTPIYKSQLPQKCSIPKYHPQKCSTPIIPPQECSTPIIQPQLSQKCITPNTLLQLLPEYSTPNPSESSTLKEFISNHHPLVPEKSSTSNSLLQPQEKCSVLNLTPESPKKCFALNIPPQSPKKCSTLIPSSQHPQEHYTQNQAPQQKEKRFSQNLLLLQNHFPSSVHLKKYFSLNSPSLSKNSLPERTSLHPKISYFPRQPQLMVKCPSLSSLDSLHESILKNLAQLSPKENPLASVAILPEKNPPHNIKLGPDSHLSETTIQHDEKSLFLKPPSFDKQVLLQNTSLLPKNRHLRITQTSENNLPPNPVLQPQKCLLPKFPGQKQSTQRKRKLPLNVIYTTKKIRFHIDGNISAKSEIIDEPIPEITPSSIDGSSSSETQKMDYSYSADILDISSAISSQSTAGEEISSIPGKLIKDNLPQSELQVKKSSQNTAKETSDQIQQTSLNTALLSEICLPPNSALSLEKCITPIRSQLTQNVSNTANLLLKCIASNYSSEQLSESNVSSSKMDYDDPPHPTDTT